MSWNGWHNTPVRKPLPVLSVLFSFAVIAWYMGAGTDIPTNMMYLLAAIDGVSVGGYMGSSAYESRYGDGWSTGMQQTPGYNDPGKEDTH